MATTKRASGRLTPTQARAARRARRARRRRFLRYGSMTLIGTVAAAFIIALFLPGLPFSFSTGGAPDGPGQRFAEVSRDHVAPGVEHEDYNSWPATSGPHYGQPLGPVPWEVYDDPLAPEQYVHNLEHGGIGVFYNCPDGCDELVTQLTSIVEEGLESQTKIFLSPISDTDFRISLAAWTFLDQFEEFDDGRIRAFVNSHHSSPNAPEPNAR